MLFSGDMFFEFRYKNANYFAGFGNKFYRDDGFSIDEISKEEFERAEKAKSEEGN